MKSNFKLVKGVHEVHLLSNGGMAVIKKGDGRLVAYNKTYDIHNTMHEGTLPKIWDWVRKDS